MAVIIKQTVTLVGDKREFLEYRWDICNTGAHWPPDCHLKWVGGTLRPKLKLGQRMKNIILSTPDTCAYMPPLLSGRTCTLVMRCRLSALRSVAIFQCSISGKKEFGDIFTLSSPLPLTTEIKEDPSMNGCFDYSIDISKYENVNQHWEQDIELEIRIETQIETETQTQKEKEKGTRLTNNCRFIRFCSDCLRGLTSGSLKTN